jgi:hypothetical protein
MANSIGSHLSDSDEEPVFENKVKPLDDQLIKAVELKVRLRKKVVTESVTKIENTIKTIQKAADGGSSGGNNLVIAGYISAGAGYIQKAQCNLEKLESSVGRLSFLFEQVRIQFPEFGDSVEEKLKQLEEINTSYGNRVTEVVDSGIEHFKTETVSAPGSVGSSRSNSPARKRFLNMKHLLPETLSSECSIMEYCKFKRDFSAWLEASYPDGYSPSEMFNAFMSRVDAGWQQRAGTTPGMEESGEPATLWHHCDAIMLILQPLHTRRMKFLGTKHDKGMKLSAFLQKLKDEAKNAEIASLSEHSLILHIFTANIQGTSDLNRTVKSSILEELRKEPNQLELNTIMNNIKGHEADNLAGVDTKNRVNFVDGEGAKREYLCRLCKKMHEKWKCSVQCDTCKKRGSHVTADCFHKDKGVVDPKKQKRDRSHEKGDKRRQRKRAGTPKPRGRARRTRDDSDSDVTDRASEISSADDEAEDTQPPPARSRHVKHRSRRLVIEKTEKNSDPPTGEESAIFNTALPQSESRKQLSSYRELLKKTKIEMGGYLPDIEGAAAPQKHNCRKIRRVGQVSATMMGKILTKGCNRRETFIADSGTTIPIVPAIIAARNKLDVFADDQDEPGVMSASGHDMNIIGQAVFFIKFDILKTPRK